MRLRDMLATDGFVTIGTYEFDAERIIEFAREFDPHFFHVDAEAARHSLFGGLCASGWHVCAAAMKCNVAFMKSEIGRAIAAGNAPPKVGPSPGIRNLKWLKPVFAGDTVTFAVRYVDDKPVPNRPGRHICDLSYEGTNQNGEKVLQFECSVVEFE
jgi:acyl dehydratase